MIKISNRGSFNHILNWMHRMELGDAFANLDKYGRMGVDALSSATPVASGLTAASWNYRIVKNAKGPAIEWYNTNQNKGIAIVILIQYGHGTRGGGYVQGRDFINPAIQPIFDQIAADYWKRVTT